MKLLLLVNGNAKRIFEAQSMKQEDFEIIKINEKLLAKPRKMLSYLRQNHSEIYFGCLSIEFQRFIPFMLIYILLSKPKKGGIIDEEGAKVKFNAIKTILITIPLLMVEAVGSFFIVVYSFIYYFVWRKWKIKS